MGSRDLFFGVCSTKQSFCTKPAGALSCAWLEKEIYSSITYIVILFTGKSKEATGAAASSRARTTSSSSAEGEDDFLAVTAPEMPEDNGQSDGFVNKIKKWCSWLYYYVAITVDKVINLLNDISKDYREIADQLKKERKEKRVERLRRKFGYAGARSRLEEDPEADTKVCFNNSSFLIPWHQSRHKSTMKSPIVTHAG